ncbi:MAG TPA: serine/threonine-protein kinase, partial [Gemmataceae bacterium]
AGLVAALADAVAYAHQRGVVHRDLKPANVLLAKSQAPNPKSQSGNSPGWDLGFGAWDFSPKVTDFGLAKLADAGEPLTRSGAALGTPGYMAPEQARGRTAAVGPAVDVYALGAILYECLTGRPPFRGESDVETLQQVCDLDPVPPRRLRPAVPRDLETVCLKCLEKEPGRRYASAAELADDLRRVVDGRPVAARPVGPLGKLRRWARRKPVVAGLAAALVASLGVGAAAVGREYRRAEAERDAAVAERDRTGRLLDQARTSLGEMIGLGHNLVHAPDTVGQGLDILEVARRYHTTLLREDPDNTPIREQAVLICRRLALIRGERGERDAADAAWAEAAAHAEALAAGPGGDKHRSALVSLMTNWAEPLYFHGRFAECLAATERALPTAQAVDADRPDDPAASNGLVDVQYWRGMALWRVGRWPEGAAALQDALGVVRRHGPAYAARYGVGPEHNCLCRLSEGYSAARDLVRAEAYAREAVALIRAAVERRPADADLQIKLAASLNILGRPLYTARKLQAAVDAFRESNRIFAAHPQLTAFTGGVYQGYQRAAAAIARALAELGRPDDAGPDLTAAVRLPPPPPRAGRMNPTPPELFECYLQLIELALRHGETETARTLHAEAVGRLPPPEARSEGELAKWADLLTALGPKLRAKSTP